MRAGRAPLTDPQPVQAPPGPVPASPPARRASRPSWRDPRLVVGILIVAVSVLAGARVLAGADDTVPVWAARADLPVGVRVSAGDLERQDVRFASPDLAGRYVSAREAVPAGSVLARAVDAGELLPRAALTEETAEDHVEVPLAAPAEAVPVTLRAGEVVDVWVAPQEQDGEAEAVRVLEGVRVVAVPRDSGALGPAATRQVVVRVPAAEEDALASALAELSSGTVVVVRRG